MSSHDSSERKTEKLNPVTAEILLDELMDDFERKASMGTYFES